MTKPRTNWSSTPRAARKSPILETTQPPEVLAALRKHCERTGETKSAVVERALRRELGLEEREEEG